MESAWRWLVVGVLAVAAGSPAAAEEGEAKVVKDGATVGIEYTLKLDDGSVADTSKGGDPLVYEQGSGQILPALEQSLAGLAVGEEKQVTLSPEQGYGPIREELYQAVAIDEVPEGAREVGTPLMARDSQGQERPLRVHEVREEEIVLDLNHPLAGETLVFDVKVVSVD